jgi:hypothetical protein
MNVSEEKGKEIESQRERELQELRSKGVAKSRREKLKDRKFHLNSMIQVRKGICIIRNSFHRFFPFGYLKQIPLLCRLRRKFVIFLWNVMIKAKGNRGYTPHPRQSKAGWIHGS